MKLNRIFSMFALFAALLVPAFGATSVASLKGTYAFQISGVSNQYGYYVSNVWHQVNTCPAKTNCQNQAFPKLTVGTISFNGAGKATFLSITQYNQGSGGPVKGTVWPYTVSGFNGLLGTIGNGAALTLGAFNAAGHAMVVQFLTIDKQPMAGTAILEQ